MQKVNLEFFLKKIFETHLEITHPEKKKKDLECNFPVGEKCLH